MSSESTPVKLAVLITIIGEAVLKDRIVKLLKSKGVTGYTMNQVQGEGGHGRRMGDMTDIIGYNTNIEIKTVVPPEASDDILRSIAEIRNGHALIAFRQKVDALCD
jgi:nitrogen regulatory protein PII